MKTAQEGAGRFDNVHGDEDWVEISDEAVQEAAFEIICDPALLESQLEDTELASSLSDICCCIDKACHGDASALQSLTRAGYQLKLVLLALVEDKAYEMASDE